MGRLVNTADINNVLMCEKSNFGVFAVEIDHIISGIISKCPTIENHKWIPVSERLPKDGEKVVVTLEDGDARIMTFYRSKNDWWFETDEGWEYKAMARAWMPSYKEGEE